MSSNHNLTGGEPENMLSIVDFDLNVTVTIVFRVKLWLISQDDEDAMMFLH